MGLQAFNLSILQDGNYSVSLTIPDKKFDDVRQCIYTSIILFRKEGQDLVYVGGNQHTEKDNNFEAHLRIGDYFIIVRNPS